MVDGCSVRGINLRNGFIKCAVDFSAAYFLDNVPVPDVPIAAPTGHSGHFFAPGMYLVPGDGDFAEQVKGHGGHHGISRIANHERFRLTLPRYSHNVYYVKSLGRSFRTTGRCSPPSQPSPCWPSHDTAATILPPEKADKL